MSKNENRRVVVTGIGAVTPIGLTVDEFWQSMMEGKSGAAEIKSFDTSKLDTKFACELKGFDATKQIDKKTVKRLDPYAQYALASAAQAIEDSKLDSSGMSEYEKSHQKYFNPEFITYLHEHDPEAEIIEISDISY